MCFRDAHPSLVEIYAKQIFSSGYHIAGNEEAAEESKVFAKEMVALSSKRPVDS